MACLGAKALQWAQSLHVQGYGVLDDSISLLLRSLDFFGGIHATILFFTPPEQSVPEGTECGRVLCGFPACVDRAELGG